MEILQEKTQSLLNIFGDEPCSTYFVAWKSGLLHMQVRYFRIGLLKERVEKKIRERSSFLVNQQPFAGRVSREK